MVVEKPLLLALAELSIWVRKLRHSEAKLELERHRQRADATRMPLLRVGISVWAQKAAAFLRVAPKERWKRWLENWLTCGCQVNL